MTTESAVARPPLTLLSEDEEAFRDAVAGFATEEVKPRVAAMERAGKIDPELIAKYFAMGLMGIEVPEQYGGAAGSLFMVALAVEEVSKIDAAAAILIDVQNTLVNYPIARYGSEALKAKYLPRLTSDTIGAYALSEPGSGSDAFGMATRAEQKGDAWVLNGRKMWITNGAEGSCFALLVKTAPDAQPRYQGMSLFIAPKMEGFTVGRKLDKLGYKSIDTVEMIFENYRVPADHLIGGVEGRGFAQTTGGLELGRINVAARGVGIAEGALKLAADYSQTRQTFGKPICEHQAIQLKLGEMATRARAARLLTLDAAAIFDRGERCDMEAGMAKYFSSEAALENAIEGMRIHGAYGYSKEYDIERLYRDAPLTCIGEGTNEMQRIIIAKQLIKRNPAA